MEESITSDLADTGSVASQSVATRRSYPRRIVPDGDDDDDATFDETLDDFGDDETEEEDGDKDDDDYEPGDESGERRQTRLSEKVKEKIPLELRRDHMTVEEVAEEELRLLKEQSKKAAINRETRSNAKGDTKVQFFQTLRGGKYKDSDCRMVVFRGFPFQSSRVGGNGKHYWRCPLRPCKAALTLLNEKFCSTSGEHDHPSTLPEMFAAIERRKKKKERAATAREKRLEQLRQKEIERRNNLLNGIVVEPEPIVSRSGHKKPAKKIHNIWGGEKPPPKPVGLLDKVKKAVATGNKRDAIEGLDELDVDDIDQLPTNLNFDMDFFNNFCTKMDRLFQEIQTYGLLQENMKKDWDTLKGQVKSVAKARIKIKDQRYRAMRIKLDKSIVDRDVALETKRILDEKIKTLNIAGAELLINQIKELQGKNSVFQIVNGEVVAKEVDEYKVKFEKAVKERDMLRLKIKNLASAASSSLAFLNMDTEDMVAEEQEQEQQSVPSQCSTPIGNNNHNNVTQSVTVTTSNRPPQSTHHGNVHQSGANVHAVQAHQQQHHAHQANASASVLSMPTYSQTLQQAAFHGWQVM